MVIEENMKRNPLYTYNEEHEKSHLTDYIINPMPRDEKNGAIYHFFSEIAAELHAPTPKRVMLKGAIPGSVIVAFEELKALEKEKKISPEELNYYSGVVDKINHLLSRGYPRERLTALLRTVPPNKLGRGLDNLGEYWKDRGK